VSTRLIEEMLSGSRVALSRILSRVENDRDASHEILGRLSPPAGGAVRIGFTGPPGAGKSSLAAAYVKFLRSLPRRVGVLAVDPTSPFSGGALLGDRVRMGAIALDEGVFVRSLATRGDSGGLAEAAGDMADVLEAAGYDTILFETVGVGQSELEVTEHADCTAVVLMPESGDAIQGMKAGLMEIADVFVINKADRDGADRFATDLRSAMHLKPWGAWTPPVVLTVATRAEGVATFHLEVQRHLDFLRSSGLFESRRAERLLRRIRRMVDQRLCSAFWTEGRLTRLKAAIGENRSPHEIVSELLKTSA
jgi:LAO/AO transport system kinase